MNGSYRNYRHGEAAALQLPAIGKRPPAHLNAPAKAVWKRVSAELLSIGLLSSLDLDLFASYAVSVATVEDVTRRLNMEDLVCVNERTGQEYANPLSRMRVNAISTMRALAVELGITPSARARLHVAPPKAKDPFEEFLDGYDADANQVLQ